LLTLPPADIRQMSQSEIVILERLNLQRFVAEGDFLSHRFARCERYDRVGRESALGENFSISRPTFPVAPITAIL
jgi:hypothetical protein